MGSDAQAGQYAKGAALHCSGPIAELHVMSTIHEQFIYSSWTAQEANERKMTLFWASTMLSHVGLPV